MGTLDPSGLRSGTAEVVWWARRQGATLDTTPGSGGTEPSAFRRALLDAWAVASRHEHDRLRLAFPEYAGAILMWQLGGLPKVLDLLDGLDGDVAYIAEARTARRVTFRPVVR